MGAGGAERVASILCNTWSEQGHSVTLMPTFSGRGDCKYKIRDEVELVYLADLVTLGLIPFLGKIIRVNALRKFILQDPPDVVISFQPHVNIAALLCSFRLPIPVIVCERSYPGNAQVPMFMSMIRYLLYPRAHAIVCQTKAAKIWLERRFPVSKISIISNPISFPLPLGNSAFLKPEDFISSDRLILLSIGRLGPEKGYDLLIEAFSSVASEFKEWDLVIVGEGENREALDQVIQNHGLTNRVFLPGEAGNPGDWYDRADLFAMTSWYEGFPNALLEAMSYGTASISFDCLAGPAEMIEHKTNGYLVPPQQGSLGFGKALQELMSDAEMRNEFGKEAKSSIQSNFSLEKVNADWMQTIQETLPHGSN
jgi:GalNAc-alpha-(1->4)-GalNAc-alpha-(1->3)-diNAcBac-PP-undecaprenol alpha-1,4-N-acetyl-D-galactosaminyltransferase